MPYSESKKIDIEKLKNVEIKNKAVLFHTGWDAHWNTEDYYDDSPYLTKEPAEYLRDSEARLVGLDSHNINDTSVNGRPVHTVLLGAEILIVEHFCNLDMLPKSGFLFSAIPPKIKKMGTFPVRAFTKIILP